jgi:thymidylate kinase
MHPLLLHTFQQLEYENISYCLLRGYEELDEATQGGDVDLLVEEHQFERVRRLLCLLGFVHLPNWGYTPHQFFVAYDEASDGWLKLDIVTSIYYGKPIPSIETDLAVTCLDRRQRIGAIFALSCEDEFITLLLHCVLDKGEFAPHRQRRLETLRHEVIDELYLTNQLRKYFSSGMTWARLASRIDESAWAGMLAERTAIMRRLTHAQKLGTFVRNLRGRILRKLDRVAGMLQPRSLTVALLAPDGGGKTTLATELTKTFYLPSRYIYMGTNIEASTIGLPTTRWIHSHAQRSGNMRRLPMWLVARGLRFGNHMLEQWYRYATSYYHMARGRLVLFDRYVYDAPSTRAGKRSLKSRARSWLLSAPAPAPNMIVFLDAPGEVLYARKGEHSPAILEQQRQHYLDLRDCMPQMLVVDATRDADQVRRAVTSLIWQGYASQLRQQ